MTSDEIRDLFNFVDLDDSNSIEVKEFLVTLAIGSVLDLLKFDGQEKEVVEMLGLIVSAYLLFDPKAVGLISKSDIDKMFEDNSNSESCKHHAGKGGALLSKQRWDEMDWDQNGNIDFAEFVFAFSKWIDLEDEL
jgi:calcium-binding protein CML